MWMFSLYFEQHVAPAPPVHSECVYELLLLPLLLLLLSQWTGLCWCPWSWPAARLHTDITNGFICQLSRS